jgi:hypothetical protein
MVTNGGTTRVKPKVVADTIYALIPQTWISLFFGYDVMNPCPDKVKV